MITYRSTRGHGPVPLADALVQGLAPDGGLYLPGSLPEVPLPAPGSLAEVGWSVLAPFLGDRSAAATATPSAEWVAEALALDTPLLRLTTPTAAGGAAYLLDLARGPTAAFKDVGARFLARALAHLAPPRAGRVRTVLVATSGDTGGAVASAFHGVAGLRVVVLFPAHGVSERQRRQFTTLGEGVVALGVDGPFDLCQALVKEALADPVLAAAQLLTSANSINVGRLLPQTTYYVKCMAEFADATEPPVFIVPSGNLGNLTAGLLAASMTGVPARFVAAVNDNDAFAAWAQGRPHRADAPTVATPSTAMDVGQPSNLERIEHLCRRDPGLLDRLTVVSIPARETLDEMRRQRTEHGRFVDPHTAVGLAALRRLDAATVGPGPAVVLSTAHPGKFPDTVERATGERPPIPPALAGLDARSEHWTPLPATLSALRSALS